MSITKRLSIALICLSVALVSAIFGMVFVLTEDTSGRFQTDFSFEYDNSIPIFETGNAMNNSSFNGIDTSLGIFMEKPDVIPIHENQCFVGWYLDEDCSFVNYFQYYYIIP